ncbi:major vault protein [Thecamonas trahens ATCC 50062]|uniref:Major vault protein n=1 Tax=Thecamonas trahens ATCC 50062 TaxID=461836 RepID=A0A0L0DY13_THETB|nr:major vault protein [Thecamonas trahens ATCC 50062]KNC56433.1 major vault protein [Thecamonas trahens ATCC 50062]|eukprot:XP_013760945.1 major vault protein [Thecamonas trahens ATCC 50062]
MSTCTYATTGANFKYQEWYECATCGMNNGSGVCAVCAMQCHRGHNLSAPKHSKFYCDCGAGGCQAMSGGKKKTKKVLKVAKRAPAKQQLQQQPLALRQVQQMQQMAAQQQSLAAPMAQMQQQLARGQQSSAATAKRSGVSYEPRPMQQAALRAVSRVADASAVPRARSYVPNDLRVDVNSPVIRLPPGYFVHVLDTNSNVTRVHQGPATLTTMDHEQIVLGPRAMIVVPPAHYCVVADPVVRDDAGEPVVEDGQFKVAFGERKVVVSGEPFLLYPGESMASGVTPLFVVPEGSALRLRSDREFTDGEGVVRPAGSEWYVRGPQTYTPLVEATPVELVYAVPLEPTQALRLAARSNTVDAGGKARSTGEEWLVRNEFSYLPGVEEIVRGIVDPIVLSPTQALHMRATQSCTDGLGVARKAGSQWLLTRADAAAYIPGVFEQVVGVVDAIVLMANQYVVVVDPVDANGVPQLGRAEVRRGEASFFLHPGESLHDGIQEVQVLGKQEALLCRATESFEDAGVAGADEAGASGPIARGAGDRWLVEGPCEYLPPVCVQVLDRRSAIPLDKNEGIYVRDCSSGAVRSVTGSSYLLRENEELWEKDLPESVEQLLVRYGGAAARVKHRVVSFRVPHNAVAQIYDYRRKSARLVFGPGMVMLEPDEQFTQLTLSGGKPKRSGAIRDVILRLGPDYMTDILNVETSDHARLSLKLSYSWHFDVDPADESPEGLAKARALFSVPDFVGDGCKAIASRVRGVVASIPFDQFHRNSAAIIAEAVFGIEPTSGNLRTELRLPNNNLVIDAVDVQTVEPVDKSTRDSLMRSVQNAIQDTTDAVEAEATNKASQKEQQAMGELQRQKILDDAKIEEARQKLLELQADSRAIMTSGSAKAEAEARATAQKITATAEIELAELRATAANALSESELARMAAYQQAEIDHQRALNDIEAERSDKLVNLEVSSFKTTVDAIGADVLTTIAQAGPEMQAQLLQSLNLKTTVLTDGTSPINLFNSANGLVGAASSAASASASG